MTTCKNPLALCRLSKREKFWLEDFTELYKDGNYLRFFPMLEMTKAEQLNAVTRFSFYFIILIMMFFKNIQWLYIPLTLLVLTIMFYFINKMDDVGKHKELDKILGLRKDKREDEMEAKRKLYSHDGEEGRKDILYEDTETEETQEHDIRSGTYDSNGDLRLGPKFRRPKFKRGISYLSRKDQQKLDSSLYTVDELIDHKKNTCRKPTPNNPFMNPALPEFGAGDPPAACNVDDEDIKDNMKVNFNHDLFRDVDEIWERENSQRQFYSVPNTAVPNNQIEFAKWLYHLPYGSCKEDQECTRGGDAGTLHEDLRYSRLYNI